MTRRLLRALAVAIAVIVSSPSLADAHSFTGFYQHGRWKEQCGGVCVGGNIPFFFTASFPGGAWRERVRNAAQAWNALAPSRFRWLEHPATGDFEAVTACPPVARRNGVHLRDLRSYFDEGGSLGRYLAVTMACHYNSTPTRMHSANIIFDASDNWSTETAGPPSGAYYDVQSTGTHEFGHASGHTAHWDAAATICSGTSRHTMCASTPIGTTGNRTLEDHDRHTFLTAY